MPIKSSRFSRTAYARRAAALAEDLNEWRAIYQNRANWAASHVSTGRGYAATADQFYELLDLVDQLRGISIRILALRTPGNR